MLMIILFKERGLLFYTVTCSLVSPVPVLEMQMDKLIKLINAIERTGAF
jgi:hypothetical protein